jgi:hypothetical protein
MLSREQLSTFRESLGSKVEDHANHIQEVAEDKLEVGTPREASQEPSHGGVAP